MNRPSWLRRGMICHHRPTGVAFRAHALKADSEALFIDGGGCLYPVLECEPAPPEWFQRQKRWFFSEGKVFPVYPHDQGFVLSANGRTVLIRLMDEVSQAAKALATAFDGVVVEGMSDDW